jgi:hypothetical protein
MGRFMQMKINKEQVFNVGLGAILAIASSIWTLSIYLHDANSTLASVPTINENMMVIKRDLDRTMVQSQENHQSIKNIESSLRVYFVDLQIADNRRELRLLERELAIATDTRIISDQKTRVQHFLQSLEEQRKCLVDNSTKSSLPGTC